MVEVVSPDQGETLYWAIILQWVVGGDWRHAKGHFVFYLQKAYNILHQKQLYICFNARVLDTKHSHLVFFL